MIKPRFFFAIVALMVVVVLSGCSFLQSACNKALPVLLAGESYSADASQALDQVQRYVDGMTISADKKKIIQTAIDKATAALRAAEAIVATSAEACSKPDMLVVFKGFVEAWSELKSLFGTADPGLIGATPSYPGIVDPAIYRKARSSKGI